MPNWFKRQPSEPSILVLVRFHRMGSKNRGVSNLFTCYREWTLSDTAPKVGQWVWAPHPEGWMHTAIVVDPSKAQPNVIGENRRHPPKIDRLVTAEEIAEAKAQRSIWLAAMRQAAGLAPTSPVSTLRSTHYWPDIPPAMPDPRDPRQSGAFVDGDCWVDPTDKYANRFGGVWWLAMKETRDPVEAATFEMVARRWYKLRDRAEIQGVRIGDPFEDDDEDMSDEDEDVRSS